MKESDVIVIGAGTGGYVAAIRAAQLGAKVTLVEKDALGGTCLNWGCIPTKALLRGTELAELARNKSKSYGVNVGPVTVDFSQMMARKGQVVQTLVKGLQGLMKANGIEVIKGTAKVASPQKVTVKLDNGETETLAAKKLILAPGSVVATIPIPGADGPGVITSNEALQLTEVPESLVVIGGGAIGVEFSTIFAGLGTTITILEMLPEIIPTEDEELARSLKSSLQKKGMEILTGAKVSKIEGAAGSKSVTVSTGAGERQIKAQLVLMAVGRKPNTEGLGLEEIGVKTERGRIIVNEKMETSVPGVYAIGDAIGGILLAHVASAEGEVAAENALGKSAVMDYRVVPRCVYTLPEISAVGMTEKEAKEKGAKVAVGRFPFVANGKALILEETEGFIKLVSDAATGEVLGVHIVGPHATDLIAEAALCMKMEGTVEEINATIHAHPTIAEAVLEASLDTVGGAVHIPPKRVR